MGNRPRGLQRARRGLGLSTARPCPFPRLPLGRGWPARYFRQSSAPLFRSGAVERPRPNPERTALRADQPRGKPQEEGKEYYYYLDKTPTHSYMKALYKYPQAAFPYQWLVEANLRRGPLAPEYELMHTGVFNEDRYFDLFVEYAKAGDDDILIRITAINRGPDCARLHLLPTLWFRNTWSWNRLNPKPRLRLESTPDDAHLITAEHPSLGS